MLAVPFLLGQFAVMFVSGMDAQLQGTLAVDAATNCLVVAHATGRLVDVAWPSGWSVAIRDGSVVLLNAVGETMGGVGDAVAVGGGFIPPDKANCVACTKSSMVFAASGEMRLL